MVYTEYLAFAQACILMACAAYCMRLRNRAPAPHHRWHLLAAFFAFAALGNAVAVPATALDLEPFARAVPHLHTVACCCLLGYGCTRILGGPFVGALAAALGAMLYLLIIFLGMPSNMLRLVFSPLSGMFATFALLSQAFDSDGCATRGPCPWRLLTSLYVALYAARPVIQLYLPQGDGAGDFGSVLLLHALPALLATLSAVYIGLRLERATSKISAMPISWRFSTTTGTLVLTSILIAGFAIPFLGNNVVEQNMARQLLMRVQAAGKALAPEWVVTLTGKPEDVTSPIYKRLHGQLNAIRLANPDLRFVYLVGKRANTPIILLDTEPIQSPEYAPPGELYAEAPPELRTALTSLSPTLTRPYTDRWGTWVSGYAPITDISGRTYAVLGMDIDAKSFRSSVGLMRFACMGFVLLACGLVPAFFAINRRNQRLLAAADRLQDESDARQRAQAGQERSEEQYRTLVEKAYDGMALVRDGTVLYANPKFAAMAALTPGEMIGRPVFDFVPNYRGPIATNGETYQRDGGKYEAYIANFKGENILAEIRSTPVVYRNRAADLVTLRDVTKLRKNEALLREAEARFALVFTHHPLAMLIYETATGTIVDANPAAVSLYGYTRDELLKCTFADIASSCGLESAQIAAPNGTKRSSTSIEWHVGKNKVPFPVEATAGVFHLSGREVACMVVRSAMRRVEAVRVEREARKSAQTSAFKYRDVLHFAGRALDELAEGRKNGEDSQPALSSGTLSMTLLADTLKALNTNVRPDSLSNAVPPMEPMQTAMERFEDLARQRNIPLDIVTRQPMPGVPAAIHTSSSLLHLVLANMIHSALSIIDSGSITLTMSANVPARTICYTINVAGGGLPSERLSKLFDLHPAMKTLDAAPPPREALGISMLLADSIGARIKVRSDGAASGAAYILIVPFGVDSTRDPVELNACPAPEQASSGAAEPQATEPKPVEETENVPAAEPLIRHETHSAVQNSTDKAQDTAPNPAGNKSDLDLWNRDAILQRLEIDESFLMELCSMFHDNAPQIMESIATSLEKEDLDNASKQAHALKNECMNVGSDLCRDICERLVRAGRQGQTDDAKDLGAQLAEAMGRLLDVLPGKK